MNERGYLSRSTKDLEGEVGLKIHQDTQQGPKTSRRAPYEAARRTDTASLKETSKTLLVSRKDKSPQSGPSVRKPRKVKAPTSGRPSCPKEQAAIPQSSPEVIERSQ